MEKGNQREEIEGGRQMRKKHNRPEMARTK